MLAAGARDANMVPLGARATAPAPEPVAPIPDVEWWDARILKDKSSYGNAAGACPGWGSKYWALRVLWTVLSSSLWLLSKRARKGLP